MWQPPYNANLFTNPVPFNQYSWRRVHALAPTKIEPQPYNILVFSGVPFYQTNWLGPKGIPPAASLIPAYNIGLYAAPFTPADWSRPWRATPAPAVPIPYNFGIYEIAAIPFSQLYWTRSRFQQSFPPPTSSVPIPLFVRPTAQKIIALDAAYGSADVVRFYRVSVLSQANVGDNVAILLDVGKQLDPSASLQMVFTRPDGTVFSVVSPYTYAGQPSAATGKGIFDPSTYAVCVLTGTQVNQQGIWSCYLQAGVFASSAQQFYIGPPAVLI